jgi:TetR/AcrR family transcriptional regulator, transcriptional repressor for nem operon
LSVVAIAFIGVSSVMVTPVEREPFEIGLCDPLNTGRYWVVKPSFATVVDVQDTAGANRPGTRLTRKGQATRERILECAAELIYRHGVQGTSNDAVRRAAGVSGSQLTHYFPDKESLVRATLAWRAESMMGLRATPPRGPLDSMAALRAWADSYVENPNVVEGGCSFGSLAAEVLKSDLDVGDAIAAGFERWRAQFREGLITMRDRGQLRSDADPDQLATSLMAAFQGGLLLTQAARDIRPLREALDAALAYVASYTTDGAPTS